VTPSVCLRGPRTRAQSARRAAYLLITALMFVAHGGRLGHMLLVQHAVCEHGDLVHDGHGAERDDAVEARETTVRAAPSNSQTKSAVAASNSRAKSAVAASTTGEHDHCDAASILHRIEPPQPPPALATVITLLPVDEVGGEEVRPVAPLDLAPKASPPSNS